MLIFFNQQKPKDNNIFSQISKKSGVIIVTGLNKALRLSGSYERPS